QARPRHQRLQTAAGPQEAEGAVAMQLHTPLLPALAGPLPLTCQAGCRATGPCHRSLPSVPAAPTSVPARACALIAAHSPPQRAKRRWINTATKTPSMTMPTTDSTEAAHAGKLHGPSCSNVVRPWMAERLTRKESQSARRLGSKGELCTPASQYS